MSRGVRRSGRRGYDKTTREGIPADVLQERADGEEEEIKG